MRYGRPGAAAEDRAAAPTAVDDGRDSEHGHGPAGGRKEFILETEEEHQFEQIEEWILLADRRLERLDAKIDRLGAAIDQMSHRLESVLTEMPTRRGINLYLVGGLIGGLAVGLAIMGITIGGFVGGLSSLRGEPAQMAPAPAYPSQPQAPIIIQMPSNSGSGQPMMVAPPAAVPPTTPAK
jgi:hypothetical protein